MNKRFQELSYEAQRYALNNTTGSDLAGLNELWQEKFAELIVAECMEVFSKDLPEPGDGKMLEVINRVCNVAEHFGVEN